MLERIFATCREALKITQTRVPLADVKARAMAAPMPRPFAQALGKREEISIIAEIKFRSPSAGQLRPTQPLAEIASDYAQAGAEALSILTEPDFFDGRLEYIEQAKWATTLPVLRKDFLFDPYQIYESRAAGADAVLLIAVMLERAQLADLAGLAKELGLDVLLELHDEADLLKSLDVAVPMIGVNHRNLKTMAIDLDTSRRLFPLVPDSVIRVAESGIENSEQLALMRERGADAALIGTSLMRASSPGAALRHLRAAICGSSSAA